MKGTFDLPTIVYLRVDMFTIVSIIVFPAAIHWLGVGNNEVRRQ
jgi:hypothetical protein